MLGPTAGPDFQTVSSAVLEKPIQELNPQLMPHEDVKGFHLRCNAILAHQGVPLKLDASELLFTEDAVTTITAIVQKVNAVESMFPLEAISDLYIRMGVIYWTASRGILLRTTPKKWRQERKAYLLTRAKDYLAKVKPGDDLYSIAARNMGLLCMDAEEWTEAEEHLADALRHFPNDVRIGEALATAHLMLGNQVEALSKVDEVINLGETPALWVLKGRVLRDMDRYGEAIECFNRALALEPRYLPAYDILIGTLRDTGRLEEAALAESQKSLAKRPGLERKITDFITELKQTAGEPKPREGVPGGPVIRGEKKVPVAVGAEPYRASVESAAQASAEKNYDLAIQRAEEVLKEFPGTRDAELLIIEAMILKGDLRGAAPRIHVFYEHNREDPVAWHWRGVLADEEGRWGASIQYFSKAVSLDPKLIGSWISMGEILLEHGKANGADESFSRALQIDGENSAAWLGKAKAMKQMGRWGAAIQCLDKYNTLEPKDKSSWLLKADTLIEKGKFERAIEAYDRYLELAQDDSYVLGKKGVALNSIGRSDEAKACLEEAVRLDSGNKEAAKWLKTISEGSDL